MVSATSILSKPLDRLQRLVAASSTFQTAVDADDAAEALAKVYCPQAPDTVYPRAIVSRAGAWNGAKAGTALWAREGQAYLTFEFEVNEDLDIPTQWLTYCNSVGAIISEMQATAGRGVSVVGETHLNVVNMSIEDGPWLSPVEEVEHSTLGDNVARWWVVYVVEWF